MMGCCFCLLRRGGRRDEVIILWSFSTLNFVGPMVVLVFVNLHVLVNYMYMYMYVVALQVVLRHYYVSMYVQCASCLVLSFHGYGERASE